MGKLSNRARRRQIERGLKKGKVDPSFSPEQLLYQLKYKLNEFQSERLLNELKLELLEFTEGVPLPKSIHEIRNNGQTYVEDLLDKELIWHPRLFIKYSDTINSFLKSEIEFENAFLNGDYPEALSIISKVEDQISFSHWSIEKQLLISENHFGFKKNKETLSEIVGDSNHQIVNVLSQYQSIRVERNLSHFNYEEILNRYLNLHSDKQIREYLEFKLNFFKKPYYDYKGFILSYDSNAPIIDRYNVFISIIFQILCTKESPPNLVKSVIKIINYLSKSINDPRLRNALILFDEISDIELKDIDIEFIELLDAYTDAKYERSFELGLKYIKKYPSNFDTYEITLKSMVNCNAEYFNPFNSESMAGKAFQSLYNIICKNDSTNESLLEAHKLYSSFGNSSWSYKFFTYINNEYNYRNPNFNYFKYGFINSSYFNPSIFVMMDDREKSVKLQREIQSTFKSTTVNFWIQVTNQLNSQKQLNGNTFRETLYSIKAKQVLGNYEEALLEYSNLSQAEKFQKELLKSHNVEEITSGRLTCLLQLKKYNDALNLVTDSVIANPNVVNKYGFSILLNEVKNSLNTEIQKNISAPIILHQYQQGLNDIWIAYDNFLSQNNLNYPHEIESILENFPKSKMIYFLQNICRQDIYDSSYAFENQDDLDNERIEICLLLTRVDPANVAIYIDEVSIINRNILIRKGIKQIDESKIYADVEGMKKALEKDLRESFNRSLELMAIPLDQISKLSIESTGNVVVPYFGKSRETQKVEIKEENIKITSYTRYELFADMFFKIRDKFVSSNEYGIETYLSMRIRHGTLLGEIRSVFENHFLITKKDSSTSEYLENTYWLNRLSISDETKTESVQKVLSNLSSLVDNISDDLKNKKLQIHTEKKITEGLFNYFYSENDLLALFRDKIGGIEDYDEFVDSVIEEMWARTEVNLSNVRSYILNHVKSELIKYLDETNNELNLELNKLEYPELNELVRNITECQTSVAVELEKVSQWFQRTNSKTINEFYIDLPVDASLATIRRIFPRYSSFLPQIKNSSLTKFDGEFFTQFTDLMQIIFHNITKHSQLDPQDLFCDLTITEVNGMLEIKVTNNVSPIIDLGLLNSRIDEARDLIINSQDTEMLRNEHRSGYLKIREILRSGLKRKKYTIELDNIDETRVFKTSVSFEIENLQKGK